MIVYNKNVDKPRRAIKSGSSPRDRQMKALVEAQSRLANKNDNSELVNSLTEQIVLLRQELDRRKINESSDIDFNDAVIKATEEAMAKERKVTSEYINKLENKLNSRETDPEILTKIKLLEAEVESLKNIIAVKDETIAALKSGQMGVLSGNVVENTSDSSRPQLEECFVDPSESNDSMKSSIVVDDIKEEQKEKVSDRVDKLKKLLGGGIG